MTAFFIGLSLLSVSTVIFIACLILHGSQHFHIRCCIRSKHYIGSPHMNATQRPRNSIRVHTGNLIRQIQRNERVCRSCCVGREDDFDFFPLSFLLYNMLLIIISCIIILKYTIVDKHSVTLIFNYNHTECLYRANNAIDWIISYLLILLSIWECLFNFYRFYTTYFASRKMIILNPKQIIYKFTLFAIPFLILFLCQLHVYYYLYPLIIFCYFIFNILNVWLFGHILIVQYRFVMGTEKYLTNIHDEMLQSVYMMRRVSLISSISSSIYICAFTFICNMDILLFVPILWSISCICLSLNFVRNRIYIHSKYLSCKLFCYSISCSSPQFMRRKTTQRSQRSPRTQRSPRSPRSNKQNTSKSSSKLKIIHHNLKTNSSSIIDQKETDECKQEQIIKPPSLSNITATNVFDKKEDDIQTPNSSNYTAMRWYNAIKTKINTPLSINQNPMDFSVSINQSPSRRESKSKAKPLKVLGIDSPNKRSTYSPRNKNIKFNEFEKSPQMYPPTTPIPSLFFHLYSSNTKSNVFPSTTTLTIPHDPMLCEEQNNKEINIDNDTVMEERDEFNEEEMAEITERFERKHDLIRVSAKHPQLLMQRISVNLETPPIAVSPTKRKATSPSGSRTPFSRRKEDDKHKSLLMDDEEEKKKEEEEKVTIEISQSNDSEPHIVIVPNTEINPNLVRSISDAYEDKIETEKNVNVPQTKFGVITKLKSSSTRLKNISHISFKRNRAQSDGKAIVQNKHAQIHRKTNTMNQIDDDVDADVDVVSMFGVLAKHGFYDNNNVVCAKQLRDYQNNMKR